MEVALEGMKEEKGKSYVDEENVEEERGGHTQGSTDLGGGGAHASNTATREESVKRGDTCRDVDQGRLEKSAKKDSAKESQELRTEAWAYFMSLGTRRRTRTCWSWRA